MPLYNAQTANSKIIQNLTFNGQIIPCTLYTLNGAAPVADADGWYIKPGTIVKLVGDYTVAPCALVTDVPFGIVENGLSIASHAYDTAIRGLPIGVVPFKFEQAIVSVPCLEAMTAGTIGKFSIQGVTTFNITAVTEVKYAGVTPATVVTTVSDCYKLDAAGTTYALADKTLVKLSACTTETLVLADGVGYEADGEGDPILAKPVYTLTGEDVIIVPAEAADNAVYADCIVIKGSAIPNAIVEVIV